MIHHGDCLDVMASMEPESVDAIVTDPPYGIRFMGKAWDGADIDKRHAQVERNRIERGDTTRTASAFANAANAAGQYDRSLSSNRAFQAWCEDWGRAAYRIAKPSSYLLTFGGTRTVHRLATGLEDAGWIIRDMLVWGYASGFPKSKASLKPAWEPIVMARKPGPLRMLAIDECRLPVADDEPNRIDTESRGGVARSIGGNGTYGGGTVGRGPTLQQGRWPANIVLTDPIFDGGIEGVVGGGDAGGWYASDTTIDGRPASAFQNGLDRRNGYGDTGTYSRFFLIPKAARSDREPVLGGLPLSDELRGSGVMQYHCSKCGKQMVNVPGAACQCDEPEIIRGTSQKARANVHPTVKPTDLMRHLVRLVTPAGGVVLDPFLGSGTTALAAEMEGFEWIGIEREAEYVAIAEARLNGTQKGLGI